MAEGSCVGTADGAWRVLRRLRISFGAGLVALGLFIVPPGAGRLFRAFLGMAAGCVVVEGLGLLCTPVIGKRVELASMVLGAGAMGCLAGVTGGAGSPLLPPLVASVFLYGLGSRGAGASVAALVSVTLLAVLSVVAVAAGAAVRVVLGFPPRSPEWSGSGREVAACTKCANARSDELLRLAQRDPLTGLLNRRGRYTSWLTAWSRKGRSLRSCSLTGSNAVNDKHGHLLGDRLLQRVAEAMQKAVRA